MPTQIKIDHNSYFNGLADEKLVVLLSRYVTTSSPQDVTQEFIREELGSISEAFVYKMLLSYKENLIREAAKRWYAKEKKNNQQYILQCLTCKHIELVTKEEKDKLEKAFSVCGAYWWRCPVCGVNHYLKDILVNAKIKGE